MSGHAKAEPQSPGPVNFAAFARLFVQPAGPQPHAQRLCAIAKSLDLTVEALDGQAVLHRHKPALALLITEQCELALSALSDTGAAPGSIAATLGFETATALNQALIEHMGVTGTEWRKAEHESQVSVRLPANFRAEESLTYIGRDPQSLTQRRTGPAGFCFALMHGAKALTMTVELRGSQARGFRAVGQLTSGGKLPAGAGRTGIRALGRLLGVDCDTRRFEARSANEPTIARLVQARPGLRISQTLNSFDAIAWSIIGQQISLPFAYQMLRSLVRLTGSKAPGDMRAMPTAQRVAELSEESLAAEKFSKAKISYLTGIAGLVADGSVDLNALAKHSAPQTYLDLKALRGLGPWSVNYVMMRGMGYGDCAPIGDAGLRRALAVLQGTDERLTDRQMDAAMAPFAPHRALATFHLWRSLDD